MVFGPKPNTMNNQELKEKVLQLAKGGYSPRQIAIELMIEIELVNSIVNSTDVPEIYNRPSEPINVGLTKEEIRLKELELRFQHEVNMKKLALEEKQQEIQQKNIDNFEKQKQATENALNFKITEFFKSELGEIDSNDEMEIIYGEFIEKLEYLDKLASKIEKFKATYGKNISLQSYFKQVYNFYEEVYKESESNGVTEDAQIRFRYSPDIVSSIKTI